MRFTQTLATDCIAAKINRRLAPLSTLLNNGQTIEIISAPGARPNPAWLNFVVTSKARSNIRHFIKDQKRNESIILGNNLLQKSLEHVGLNIDSIDERRWQSVLDKYHYKSQADLFDAIGVGNQLPLIIARELSDLMTDAEKSNQWMTPKQPLKIKGSQGMVVAFAECCRPIPGDPIIGIFNAGQGLMIHRENCPHIAKLATNPEKSVAVQWAENVSGEFKVDLRVEVANQRGVLANLASTIASANSNIDDISIDAHDGRFNIVHLTVSVHNRQHLAKIMRRVRSISIVTKVSRQR